MNPVPVPPFPELLTTQILSQESYYNLAAQPVTSGGGLTGARIAKADVSDLGSRQILSREVSRNQGFTQGPRSSLRSEIGARMLQGKIVPNDQVALLPFMREDLSNGASFSTCRSAILTSPSF